MQTTPYSDETIQAQLALLVIILLQVTLDRSLVIGPKSVIIALELLLIVGIGLTAPLTHSIAARLRRTFSLALIAIISLANAASMILVADSLIHGSAIAGKQLILAAFAIFVTNIIIFSIWYWEVDSPGLTGLHKHDAQPKFQFPQMEMKDVPETKNWEPAYLDYLYLSTTNSTAFSPTDAMPLTHQVKLLMGAQAMISLITVVLVTARAVNILG